MLNVCSKIIISSDLLYSQYRGDRGDTIRYPVASKQVTSNRSFKIAQIPLNFDAPYIISFLSRNLYIDDMENFLSSYFVKVTIVSIVVGSRHHHCGQHPLLGGTPSPRPWRLHHQRWVRSQLQREMRGFVSWGCQGHKNVNKVLKVFSTAHWCNVHSYHRDNT